MQFPHKGERWILKPPGHLGPLDALFDVYPDAMLIQPHRDPIRVVPSVASLEYTMRLVSSDDVDPARVNVKASTGNLAGDEGAGRTIAARAVATVVGGTR